MKRVWIGLGLPVPSILAFLFVWSALAPRARISRGAIPGPATVWSEAVTLYKYAVAKAAKEAKEANGFRRATKSSSQRSRPTR